MKYVSIKKDYIPPSLSMSIVWHEDSIAAVSVVEDRSYVYPNDEFGNAKIEYEQGIDYNFDI